jgi:hypothetical protein
MADELIIPEHFDQKMFENHFVYAGKGRLRRVCAGARPARNLSICPAVSLTPTAARDLFMTLEWYRLELLKLPT